MPNGERVYYPTIFNSKVLHSNSSHYPWPLRHYYPKFEYMIESTSIVVLQVALRSVLFVPVNVAGQTPTGQASPCTVTVFKHYQKRLSCHLESKIEAHSTILYVFICGLVQRIQQHCSKISLCNCLITMHKFL